MFPSQRGHELKYYLNKFHFLKNTGPFRNFWLQEKKNFLHQIQNASHHNKWNF